MNKPTRNALLLALSVLSTVLGCNGQSKAPPAPEPARAPQGLPDLGHDGPVPSAAAQEALNALEGKRLRPTGGSLGTAELVITDGMAVIPNPVTGKGPVVSLKLPDSPEQALKLGAPQGDGGHYFLPVLTDGDAADLIRRVTGTAPAGLAGPTSETYRKAIGME